MSDAGAPVHGSSSAKVARIDVTAAAAHVVSTGTAGLSGALQKLLWPLTTVWGAASSVVMLYDLRFHPSWRAWLFAGWLGAFAPVLAGLISLIVGLVRATRMPDFLIPGLDPPETIARVVSATARLARRQAARIGGPPRPLIKWLNLVAIIVLLPALWLAWAAWTRASPGQPVQSVLTFGFVITSSSALVLAAFQVHAASRPSFASNRARRGASLVRWLALGAPLAGLWLAIEAFRRETVPDFAFGSGTAGTIMASEAIPEIAFAVLWLGWIYLVGKSLGRELTVDELIERYRGAQITLLRSFRDDEAGIDFQGPVKPHAGWRQIRLEVPITQALHRFGPVVALREDTRTIDRVGARRIEVAADIWQAVVTRWIDASMMIVMLAGRTRSVRWELETIVARHRVNALFLVLPPRTTDALGRVENDDKEARLVVARECLANTPWAPALEALDSRGVIGLMFLPGGRIEVVSSDGSGDEDYRLAIEIAVYCMFCRDSSATSNG